MLVWNHNSPRLYVMLFLCAFFFGCTAPVAKEIGAHDTLPQLEAVVLSQGEVLKVVATTSIIADVVAQVGGGQIQLSTLFPNGTDPHSFEATPEDLITLNDAHVVLMNGLGLEESLAPILSGLDDVVLVSVNAGVETVVKDEGDEHSDKHSEGDDDHHHAEGDPHTWFNVHVVELWVENVAHTLSALDPANAMLYESNAAAYQDKLAVLEVELDEIVATLPIEKRKLVTDHDSLGQFAAVYDFEVVGSVISSFSTVASPSAQELVALQDQVVAEDVPAIFVGISANPIVAQQIAQDVGVQVVPIYAESLSEADGPAGNYLDFLRYTVTTIVEALK